MVVKKFYGATTRDALRQVRDELGPDALILSNRQVAGGGFEIMAVAEADVAVLTHTPTPPSAPSKPTPRATQNGARLMQSAQSENTPAPAAPARNLARAYAIPDEDHDPTLDDLRPSEPLIIRSNRSAPAPVRQEPVPRQDYAPTTPPPARQPLTFSEKPSVSFEYEERAAAANAVPSATPALEQQANQEIAREIRMLRGLLESQLAGMAWNELAKHAPEKLEVLRMLLAAGFCPALSRQLIDKMPSGMGIEQGLNWVKAALKHNLPTPGPDQDIIARGGVYALIGPTGVGKTTTVAKIAARCALAHGPQSVALLTTDSYRIGAHDQLRIYGRILGVPVHDIKDETDLELTLSDLSDRHLVLIDTVGMGQRDQRIGEQLALFNLDHIGTLLLLSANAQASTLDDVARRYRNSHLAGCILTKLDETMAFGGCLDVAIRHRLPLHFVTNGQRVPEDMHGANTSYLIDRAFRTQQDNAAFQLNKDEYPVFMGTQDTPLDFKLNFGGNRG